MTIAQVRYQTSRLETACLERRSEEAGLEGATRVLLVHGNVSSSAFFKPLMEALPAGWHVLAPDLRGYGGSEAKPVDATRGLGDWADDLWALLEAAGWAEGPVHALGWSMGAGVVTRLAMDHPGRVASLTLVAPVSPYGFGGTHGPDGQPNSPDFAGSGGGTVSRDFVAALAAGDRGSESPNSPRNVMLNYYFKPGYRPQPALEDEWVDAMLTTRLGDDHYPGDLTPSGSWPGVAPGTRGVANAFSPKHQDLSGFAALEPRPPVLWVRGAFDQIVSDRSMFDLALLGELGYVPGWSGAEAAPPQPMLAQTRATLEAYAANGGCYEERVLENSGHSPFIEEQAAFLELFTGHVAPPEPSAR